MKNKTPKCKKCGGAWKVVDINKPEEHDDTYIPCVCKAPEPKECGTCGGKGTVCVGYEKTYPEHTELRGPCPDCFSEVPSCVDCGEPYTNVFHPCKKCGKPLPAWKKRSPKAPEPKKPWEVRLLEILNQHHMVKNIGVGCVPAVAHDLEPFIADLLKEQLKEIESKLPKEKGMICSCGDNDCMHHRMMANVGGFNDCLSEVRKIIEEV